LQNTAALLPLTMQMVKQQERFEQDLRLFRAMTQRWPQLMWRSQDVA
jgi:hypothetical protein